MISESKKISSILLLVFTTALALAMLSCSSSSKTAAGPFEIPDPVKLPAGDIQKGAVISQEGTTAGAAACFACHGANGEGMSAGAFPRLAGQGRLYLAAQLEAYANGSRQNEVMMPIAKALTNEERNDVSAYFASLSNVPFQKGDTRVKTSALRRAEVLSTYGDKKVGLQSCQNCHGPGGIGEPPSIPALKGQFAAYTSAQLTAWKNGTRKTNPEHMGYIATLLTDADIAAVAAFYEQIPLGENKK